MIPAESIGVIRRDPQKWFESFGRVLDEHTRQPKMFQANVLQRRIFDHYRWCQERNLPCRMVVLKYRRAGSSTAAAALNYFHCQNHVSRSACVGTDYKSAVNIMGMVSTFAAHDDFPGWVAEVKQGKVDEVTFETGDPIKKSIATRLEFATGSTIELFTAQNPEACRSAGMNSIHSTEAGRWPSGGEMDAAETLMSIRNSLPKTGMHLAIEESTANGATGAFHDTCRKARYPEYADWPEMHRACWPLSESEFGRDLQFVFIFAAWFEDQRHFNPLSDAQAKRIESTLDAEGWYFGEKELISKYAQDGPKGRRLGGEVDCTLWEQLAWRRGIIEHVCTKMGKDEFAQEYPSNPLEAFRASGAPVFDGEALLALDEAYRSSPRPENGLIDVQLGSGTLGFRRTNDAEAVIQLWERPIPGAKYLVSVDPTKSAEIVKGTGERDRNSVLVIRYGYLSDGGKWYPTKLVARIKPPNQYEDAALAIWIARLATLYGRAIIVVESNLGSGLITRLRDEHRMTLYVQQSWDAVRQRFGNCYGFNTNSETRRELVSRLQEAIREQRIEILCPNVIAELRSFIFNSQGRAEASSGQHDDDVICLGMALSCLPHATTFPLKQPLATKPVDEDSWKEF